MNTQFLKEVNLGVRPLDQIRLSRTIKVPLRDRWVFHLAGGAELIVGYYSYYLLGIQFNDEGAGYTMGFTSSDQWERGSLAFWWTVDDPGWMRTLCEYSLELREEKCDWPTIRMSKLESKAIDFFPPGILFLRDWIRAIQRKLLLGYTTPQEDGN